MKCNVGSVDRVLRIIIGLVLLWLGIFVIHAGGWNWLVILLGAAALGTGLAGRCMLYVPFGISTCKVK
jgi:hypothetical protein